MAAQKKLRLNIVDFLLIILVLLSVVALFLRPTVLEKIGKLTATDTAVAVFYADNLTEEEFRMLAAGDIWRVDGEKVGELLSFSSQPYQTMQLIQSDVASENPFFEKANVPGKYTVKGQVRFTGTRRQDGFYLGGNVLVAVGSQMEVESNSYILTLEISGLS